MGRQTKTRRPRDLRDYRAGLHPRRQRRVRVTIGDSRRLLVAFRASGVGYVGALPSPAEHLPAWAARHAHTTDAYLCAVAREHGLRLATFDAGIKDPAALQL